MEALISATNRDIVETACPRTAPALSGNLMTVLEGLRVVNFEPEPLEKNPNGMSRGRRRLDIVLK